MSKKIFLAAGLSLVMAMVGGGAWAYYSMNADHPKAKQAEPPLFVKLEPLVVNIQGKDGEGRLLQVEVNLKVEGQNLANHLKAAIPELRHRLILILSSKKDSDLDTLPKKQALAEEIRSAAAGVAGNFSRHRVQESMFLSFVMQ
jgi:flagellar FliL protein